MIVYCDGCAAQNFVSPERLAVRGSPPACWECGRVLPLPGERSDPPGETARKAPESNGEAG